MHNDRASLSVVRHLGFNGCPARTTAPPPRSAVGFLLLDSSLRPLSFNAEAINVLSYPDKLADVRRPDVFLAGKIHSSLISQQSSRESPLVTEFRSGRRRYLCRAFLVDWQPTVLLTRASPSCSNEVHPD